MSTIAVTASWHYQPGMTATVAKMAGGRLRSIDALRGFVMVLMLLDHVRETWFLYVDISDPVDARTVMPALFFARLAASLFRL